MSTQTQTLDIKGMHCHSCSAIIDETVEELAGVATVATSRADNSSVITFDPDVVSVDDLVAAIADLGYQATPVG